MGKGEGVLSFNEDCAKFLQLGGELNYATMR